MTDFYEIDFLGVGSPKSGDAITIRYQRDHQTYIHIVDGGFQKTGELIVSHLKAHYGDPNKIDHVVVTHPDGDHCGGLRTVLETYEVGALWMLRPWLHVDELIHRFSRFTNKDNLVKRLKDVYSNLTALEEIAEARGIPIFDPFQGAQIGAFTVLSPTLANYLDLIERSEKTPENIIQEQETSLFSAGLKALVRIVKSAWGAEVFSPNETSAENEMSVVQSSILNGHSIVLTGDAGRQALGVAAQYSPYAGLDLPGVDKIQIPHHGSRRNVSSELLDVWLGPKLFAQPESGDCKITAIVSASEEDKHHPRKSVVRAFWHRGAKVASTEGKTWVRTSQNAPERPGTTPAELVPYPDSQEED